MMSQQHEKELRHFGLVVGGVFLVIGVWPWVWHGAGVRLWAIGVGALLCLLGALVPSVLRPVHKGWMFIGHVMGWVNTRIILGFFFYAVLTPMGLVARLLGNDFMHMKPGMNADTYRVLRAPRGGTHFRQQF